MTLSLNTNLDVVGAIVVAGAVLVAIVIVVSTFTRARSTAKTAPLACHLGDCMGVGQWDFSKSWASTLTVVGGLLGTGLSAAKGAPLQFAILNLLFVILAGVAPLVCNFIGRMEPVGASPTQRDVAKIAEFVSPAQKASQDAPTETATYQYQTYVVGFLIACVLTLWAVVGEIVTLGFLLGDLRDLANASKLAFPNGNPLVAIIQVLFLLGAIVAIFYAWQTIPFTLQAQVSHKKAARAEQKAHLMRVYGMAEEQAKEKADQSLQPALP